MGSKGQKAPDYDRSAERQAAADWRNLQYQTRSNRPNQYTPWGSSTWSEGTNGNWTNTINLSPDQQAALDAQTGIQRTRSEIAQGMLAGLGSEITTPENFWADLGANQRASKIPTYNRGAYTDWENVNTGGFGKNLPRAPSAPRQTTLSNRGGGMISGRFGSAAAKPSRNTNISNSIGSSVASMSPYQNDSRYSRNQFNQKNQSRIEMEKQRQQNQNDSRYSRNQFNQKNQYNLQDIEAKYDPRFEKTMYSRAMSLIRPEQEQATERNNTMLANMGLSQGGEAFDDSVSDLRNTQGEQTQRAAWDSVMAGEAAFDRDFGRRLASRGQQFDETAFGVDQDFRERALGLDYGFRNRDQDFRERAFDLNYGLQRQNQDFSQQMGLAGFGESQRAARLQEQAQRYDLGFREAAMSNAIRNDQAREDLAFGSQQFNQGMQAAGFNNSVRQQDIIDQLQREGWSLNKINAFMNNQQVNMPQMPQFAQAGYVGGPDYMGAAQQQTQWQSSINNMWGSLFGAFGSLGGGFLAGR